MLKPRRAALLAFCRSLPRATEDVKWGNDLCFSVGGKLFAGFASDGTDASFGCKVAESEFGSITSVVGIRPSKYAARFHWISVEDPAVMPETEAIALLRGSYELVVARLPQKLQREIAGASTSKAPARRPSAAKRPAPGRKKAPASPKAR